MNAKILLIVTIASLLATPILAEDGTRPATTAPARGWSDQDRWAAYEPRIIQLKHADSRSVAATLSSLFQGFDVRPLERSNSLLFVGPDKEYARVTKLIAEIDVPEDGTHQDSAEVRMLPVRNRRAEDLLRQLMPVLDRHGTQVAADRDRQTIIVRGPASFIEQVQTLVAKLDTPTPTVTLDFSFFGASAKHEGDGAPIPDDLKDVVKELKRFGEIRLVGQLATVATENERFKVEGNVADLYVVSIEGVLESATPDGSVRVRLDAKIISDKRETNAATQTGPPPRRPAFMLQTTVIVKRGTYAALGVAPCGFNDGQSGILVLHVQP